MTPLAAIVMAAGRGTRMRSRRSKVLHEVCGIPMVLHPVQLAAGLGARPIVVVTGHDGEQVAEVVSAVEGVVTVDQGEPRGTGHAVAASLAGLEGVEGTVVVLSGDVPLLTADTVRALVVAHEGAAAALTVLAMELADAGSYGRVVLGASGTPERIVEARDATPEELAGRLANAGIYAADAAFLRAEVPGLGNDNAQGEYYLTDLVARAAAAGRTTAHVIVADPDEVHGVNDRAELARADRVVSARRIDELMRAGVTVLRPESTRVEVDCTVGPDTVLEAGVELRRGTHVGEGVRVGTGCILVASEIGDGAEIKPYTVIEHSVVGAAAEIGPMARLRPATRLGARVRVGNFVEIKKSELGEGSKVSHLSYLGDATIGAGVNIGCGTITCNYDGETKSRTEIGDGAFIGSDSQLVAPVRVGKGAYIGSGSTITKDVPDDALAVARSRQRNIDGWAKRRRGSSDTDPGTGG